MSDLHQNTLEVALRDLLLISKNFQQASDSIFQRLDANQADSLIERQIFIRFLIQAGEYPKAFELFAKWFQEKKNIPLFEFCYLLHITGNKPTPEVLEKIEQAHQDASAHSNLTHFEPWKKYSPFWQKLSEDYSQIAKTKLVERKKSLLDKLEYFRLNRMIEEEEKLLQQLLSEYPQDTELNEQKKNFKERWARAIIAKKAIEKFDVISTINNSKLTAREQEFVTILIGNLKDHASLHPNMAYDFAISLCFLELYEPAREMLELAPSTLAVDWLYLDVLLKCRRYAEGLDALLTLETRYAHDPETVFAATYARAQALAGLGQIGSAAALLKSLVNIRPSYRSAHSLLLQWGGRS